MDTTHTAHFRFLDLPAELRNLCYKFYFEEDGGYVYNCEVEKLRTFEDKRIDVWLTLTCRRIYEETKGMAFALNRITFNSFYKPGVSGWVSRFGGSLHELWIQKLTILKDLSPFFTPAMAQNAAQKYPQCRTFLQELLSDNAIPEIADLHLGSVGPSLSIMRDCIQYLLGLLITHPDLQQSKINKIWKVVASLHEPWIIPNVKDISSFYQGWEHTPTAFPQNGRKWPNKCGRMYTLSAASVCIRFMRTISYEVLSQVRCITLQEDSVSSGYPECHTRGLISFFRAHPNLRIEQRVNLWTCVFPKDINRLMSRFRPGEYQDFYEVVASEISHCLRSWLLEASALPSLGMPEDRFELVLDGSSMPEKAAEIFQFVQSDAEWQAAWSKQFPTLGFLEKRAHPAYICEGFPEIVEGIVQGTSLIRCNFDIKETDPTQNVPKEHSTWTTRLEWKEKWEMRYLFVRIDIDIPLRRWVRPWVY